MRELTRDTVLAALARDADAIRALVADLTPVIQARAVRVLLQRRGLARGTDTRQVLEDMVQDVFVELFRDDGKALRVWDPARGLGLRGFVGMVTEQHVAMRLRGRRRNPWSEELTVDGAAPGEVAAADDPERCAASREELERLLDLVHSELSPLGHELFQRLILDGESIAAVSNSTGMSLSAVQAWSSRLKRLLLRLSGEIAAGSTPRRLEVDT